MDSPCRDTWEGKLGEESKVYSLFSIPHTVACRLWTGVQLVFSDTLKFMCEEFARLGNRHLTCVTEMEGERHTAHHIL